MNKILKGMPMKGKVVSIGEDVLSSGSLIFPKEDIRTTLVINNEALGIEQVILFVRPGEPGVILASLINDFKDGKELRIDGKISCFLIHPLLTYGVTPKELKKEVKGIAKKLAHLAGAIDWGEILENDKKALDELFKRFHVVFAESNNLSVSVDGRVRYIISTTKDNAYADIYLRQTE